MFKTRKLNAVIAIQIILSMTLYYFVLIGFTAISYAIDIVETNNHNIDFSAYFMDNNGEKTEVLEKSINEREYLYVDVTVKNEGYFNGIIRLNNNNFNIVPEIQGDNIEAISGNEVKLKQINSGTTQTIKLLIESVKDDSIDRECFNENSEIVLSGDYINSKNIDSDSKFQIYGTTKVQMIWKSSKDTSSELIAKVLTNSVYNLNENSKRVVQVIIDSNLKNNEYPINQTEIKLNAPKNTESVKVFARSNSATNGNLEFSEKNYVYDKISNTVTININNDNENVISWKKNCKDTFVVTFILDSNEDIKNQNILVNSRITTYDQKLFENNTGIILNEEADGIVTNEVAVKEKAIYKGKIIIGEERNYQTTSKININYSDIVNKIIIREQASKYLKNDTEVDTNIVYKSSMINKDIFNKLFGKQGFITIKNGDGAIIGSINSNTQADENGNLIINYNTEIKELIIETSKPIKEGILSIEHTKIIRNSNLTREDINSLTGIKENAIVNYNDKHNTSSNKNIIELKNTSSKAKFEVEQNKLTAVQKNENVKMTVVLENSNEARDLYQNPVIKIKLPSQVKNVSAKYKAMYKNGLELANASLYKENNNNILEIALQGKQNNYNTEVVDGTTIIIYADIEIDENAVSSNEEITMSYTNELATSFEDNGEEKVGIQIEEIPEEVKAKLEEQRVKAQEVQGQLNVELKGYVGGQELSEGDTVYIGEIIKYQITLENNTNTDIENVNIQAAVPEGTTLIERIFDEEEYTEKYIDKQVENNMISKTIERINHQDNNKVVLEYEIRVNENTEVKNILNNLRVTYNNLTIDKQLSSNIETTDVKLEMIMRTRADKTVQNGMEYSYNLSVKNMTNTDMKNVEIKLFTNSAYKLRQIANSENYEKITDKDNLVIENLPAGQTNIYYIDVLVDRGDQNYATIYAMANNKNRSNQFNEKIETSSFIAHFDSDNKNKKVKNNDSIVYKLSIENNGDVNKGYFHIKQAISNYYDIEKVKLNDQDINYTKTQAEQENTDYYYIEFDYSNELKPGEIINITIEIKPLDNSIDEDINISSYASINGVDTETITHILSKDDSIEYESETNESIPDDEPFDDPALIEKEENTSKDIEEHQDNDKNNDTVSQVDSNNNNETVNASDKNANENYGDNKKYSIKGNVWLDENENGQKDSNEKNINDVQITLLNIDTNNTQKINNNSTYEFSNLDKGKYIIVFKYDTNKYNLTKYQAENVSKELNSDVENNKINFEGREQILAITDVLNITTEDITNIDLGLVEAKNFDLELNKSISKITISNTEGTTVKEYDNATLAKVEIGAKYLKNSTVVIEYSIKAINTGEMAGYVKQIIDYKPTDLKFNSSLNSDWYQSGDNLYSNALENTKIEPGETKELKLVLTKEMTETNTGLTNNTAEINQSLSINNSNDFDSTLGNKKSGEDDLGQANIIIGVKTGAAISYILVSISILGMIVLVAYFLSKRLIKYIDK